MEFIPRKEIGWLDEEPDSGDPEICKEIRAAMIGQEVEKPLPVKDKRGLEKWL